MFHPFEAVPFGRRRHFFIPLLILSLIAWAGIYFCNDYIAHGATPNGIVSLELAGDPVVAHAMVKDWDREEVGTACFVVGLDFLFLVLYSSAIALACVWAAGQMDSPRAAWLGGLPAWAQWAAALFDMAENVALLFLIMVTQEAPWPQAARMAALVKFALVAAGLLYALLGAMLYGARRLARLRPAVAEQK